MDDFETNQDYLLNEPKDAQGRPDDRRIFNKNQVVQMFMEPEGEVTTRDYNRNWVLGNLNQEQFLISEQRWSTADWLDMIPADQGKFIFSMLRDHELRHMNFIYAASCSIEGFGRKSVVTQIKKEEFKDITQKQGIFSFNKQQSQ
jgi:hypothetical protein